MDKETIKRIAEVRPVGRLRRIVVRLAAALDDVRDAVKRGERGVPLLFRVVRHIISFRCRL